jgi:SAM-dependent methyltransferase
LKVIQDRERLIPNEAAILHFAAERFARLLIAPTHPKSYVTADIAAGFDIQADIEDLPMPDMSYDVVICSHVLEHVRDDRAAIAQLYRVLRPGGKLIAMVPVIEGWDETYEDSTITAPEERRLHFGQGDHVRFYGRDFRKRLAEAGFGVSEYVGTPAEVLRYRLTHGERVFVGTRPERANGS